MVGTQPQPGVMPAPNPPSAAILAAVSGLAPTRPGHGCTHAFIDLPT